MKKLPDYLTYESDSPKILRWIMETGLGATVFFLGMIAIGALIGWAFS